MKPGTFSRYAAAVGAVCALVIGTANAQAPANVPVTALLSWNLPTATTAGEPLTGGNALTAVQVFASATAIADGSTVQPTATLAATATQWTYSTTEPNGSTLYFRVKACNVGGCSGFSPQATKAVRVNLPGAPDGVTVAVSVVITVQP